MRRIPGLDGLRALSVLAVIGVHVGLRPFRGGGVGVNVFFVLSGFLITTLLLREIDKTGRLALGRFYLRRVLRLTPAMLLLVVLTAAAVTVWVHNYRHTSLHAIPWVVTYTANWKQMVSGGPSTGAFDHTWTLAVEEQFYLVWPVLLLLLLRFGRRHALAITLAFAAASLVERTVLLELGTHTDRVRGTDLAADALLLGCALALAIEHGRPAYVERLRRVCARLWPVALLALLGVIVIGDDRNHTVDTVLYGFPIATIAAAVLIGHFTLTGTRSVVTRVFDRTTFAWLGRISYGMYLFHVLVILLIQRADLTTSRTVIFVLVYLTTVAVAAASFYAFELPILRLRPSSGAGNDTPLEMPGHGVASTS